MFIGFMFQNCSSWNLKYQVCKSKFVLFYTLDIIFHEMPRGNLKEKCKSTQWYEKKNFWVISNNQWGELSIWRGGLQYQYQYLYHWQAPRCGKQRRSRVTFITTTLYFLLPLNNQKMNILWDCYLSILHHNITRAIN